MIKSGAGISISTVWNYPMTWLPFAESRDNAPARKETILPEYSLPWSRKMNSPESIPTDPRSGSSDPPLTHIRDRARELGFIRLGVCRPQLPLQGSFFPAWLKDGYHGKMAWMERGAAKRLDPSLVLPGVQSILVGAFPYPGPADSDSPPMTGDVSCYARGDDYHNVVGERAASLARMIEDEYGSRTMEYVDTGPLLERLWAAQAGIGWIGKNSLVLNKDHGSYFFLAVLLTTLDLSPDSPATDQCGSCNLCVEACPTDAIVSPRVVDSRKCISYHTIEKRGIYPGEFMTSLGKRVFGCDDCQTACPWNQDLKFQDSGHADFPPRAEISNPSLTWMAGMEMAEYTSRFRGSAMKRATFHGLRRNAVIALGNSLRVHPDVDLPESRRRQAIELLESLAEDDEPAVAEAARWALTQASMVPGQPGLG
jgi:epoxyqueuosine reductase